MYSIVSWFVHDLAKKRIWCSLDCGHKVLCDATHVPVLCCGSQVHCPTCSRVAWTEMQTDVFYFVFLRTNPSEPILCEFVNYFPGGIRATFRRTGQRRKCLEHWYMSDVAAIERA